MIVARNNFTKQWGRSRGAPRASGTRTLTLVALVVASISSCSGQDDHLCPAALLDEQEAKLSHEVGRIVNSHLQFHCSEIQHVEFERDNVSLSAGGNDGRLRLIDNRMSISHLKRSDSGCYRCGARTSSGRYCWSSPVCLSVIEDIPHVSVDRTQYHILLGCNLTIWVNVTNLSKCGPVRYVRWIVNNSDTSDIIDKQRGSLFGLMLFGQSLTSSSTVSLLIGNDIGYAGIVTFKIVINDPRKSKTRLSCENGVDDGWPSGQNGHLGMEFPSSTFTEISFVTSTVNTTGADSEMTIVAAVVSVVVVVSIIVVVTCIVVRCFRRYRGRKENGRSEDKPQKEVDKESLYSKRSDSGVECVEHVNESGLCTMGGNVDGNEGCSTSITSQTTENSSCV